MIKEILLATAITTGVGVKAQNRAEPKRTAQPTREIQTYLNFTPANRYIQTYTNPITQIEWEYKKHISEANLITMNARAMSFVKQRTDRTHTSYLYYYIEIERKQGNAPNYNFLATPSFNGTIQNWEGGTAELDFNEKVYANIEINQEIWTNNTDLNVTDTYLISSIQDQTPSINNDGLTSIGEKQFDVVCEEIGDTLENNTINFLYVWTIQELNYDYPNYNYDATDILFTNEIYEATVEVIDIPGLLFQILGMPFAFISQAFNLTLFPNTAYSINVSNLLFAVIVGLLVIVIIRKLLK